MNLGVFTDLRKAFGTVDHNILKHGLELYGMGGKCLNWFKSYLIHRQQFYHSVKEKIEYAVELLVVYYRAHSWATFVPHMYEWPFQEFK